MGGEGWGVTSDRWGVRSGGGSVSFLQNIRFLLTFRKRCEIMSKAITGNRTVLQE